MTNRKDLIAVALATFCLTASLFMIGSIRSAGVGEYNPWADINDDGIVDIYDAILLSNNFNKNGTSLGKWSTTYDSGWVNITDKAGQNIAFSHGLGMLDWNNESIVVEITGKTVPEGELLRHLGLQQLQAWNKTYGGTGGERAFALVQTTEGGYALAGFTDSYGAGGWDVWLVKTDADGNEMWNSTYGGTSDDWAQALVQTVDGGYALAGHTYSYGAGRDDFWLIKTDANGTMEWNRTYGGAYDDFGYSVVQTADGGYAIAGYTYSYGAGKDDVWLVKTDADGNEMWNSTYGGTGNDRAQALVQTVDGGYALAGYTYTDHGYFSLVKTEANGTMQWNRIYGEPYDNVNDVAFALVQTSEGGYALTGYTFNGSKFAYKLVKADANGTMQWNRTYGGPYGTDVATGLVQTVDGGFTLAGYGTDSWDFHLVRTDADGNEMWNRVYGGTGMEFALALVQTTDGGYALAGETNSYGAGGYDSWLVKTNADGQLLNGEHGLVWVDSTADAVTLYRGKQDASWNYVRVRVLKAK